MNCEIIAAEDKLVNTLSSDHHSVRITANTARHMLLWNKSRVINGTVRRYQIRHIGLDIYEVRLLPVGKKDTVLVDGVWKTAENGL